MSPWAILVSEVMLAQTPVARVVPVYESWLDRWPTAPALAAATVADALRAWGRLGYPRRAVRLHQAAAAITTQHAGQVPRSPAALRALPGIGEYTAAAVGSFAYGQRHLVLDTNVRRVLARVVLGQPGSSGSVSASERRDADRLAPTDPAQAVRWAAASMELGALVCTQRSPRCAHCPVVSGCRWHLDGHPDLGARPRLAQRWAGSDRQVRGLLLEALRREPGPVPGRALTGLWDEPDQRDRALAGLVTDGLVATVPGSDLFWLPGEEPGTGRSPRGQRSVHADHS
ncbi:MAG: HhH-GPD family protein [Actinomycetes bacterium]